MFHKRFVRKDRPGTGFQPDSTHEQKRPLSKKSKTEFPAQIKGIVLQIQMVSIHIQRIDPLYQPPHIFFCQFQSRLETSTAHMIF
jgi:hypothetical protein